MVQISANGSGIRRLGAAGVAHREYRPGTGHTFQFVLAAVGEGESRPEHQRRDHTRHKHLAWSGERHDAGRDVDGDAVDITVAFLDLAGVQSDTDLQSQLLHCHR